MRIVLISEHVADRESVRHQLQHRSECTVAAEAGDCASGLSAIREHGPDLVFLGVKLSDGDGFSFLASVDSACRPVVIFTAETSDRAAQAFDAGAVDFIVLPCAPERLALAVKRAGDRLIADRVLLEMQRPAQKAHTNPYDPAGSLAVKERDRISLIRFEDIDWIEAQADYVCIHALGKRRTIRGRISDLEQRLDPRRFARIHRSTIVNVERISELRSQYHGEYQVILRDNTALTLSRGYRSRFSARVLHAV